MTTCKAKSALLLLAAALLGGVASRALPAWPQATAQDQGDPHKKGGAPGGHHTAPQHVTVRYSTGQAQSDVLGVPAVTGFGVEEMSGGKFLVLTSAMGQRVYFAYDKVLVIDARSMGSPATEGMGKDAPGQVAPK